MAFCDFVVRYDPDKDTKKDIVVKILYSVIIKRLKAHKPAVLFVGGDSGEGKSYTAVKLQELLLEAQGLEAKDFINDMNVYTPIEYPQKLDALLFEKRLKKCNIITIHEAREVVKAKQWQSFLNQSISDINAMSRSVKRLVVIILSQFIRDIDNNVRYTINYYCMVRRPKGQPARLYINVMWKDDRDINRPMLRKRRLSGYLVYPNGRYKHFMPEYFSLSKPNKELIEIVEKMDKEAKTAIIKKKINTLVKEMKQEIGEESKKINSMVDFYTKNPEALHKVGRVYRGKWRINKNIMEMHELDKYEYKDFEKQLNKKMESMGIVDKPQDETG